MPFSFCGIDYFDSLFAEAVKVIFLFFRKSRSGIRDNRRYLRPFAHAERSVVPDFRIVHKDIYFLGTLEKLFL